MLKRKAKEQVKPVIEIKGNLGYKLECGFRAFIKGEDGNMLFTSQVVDIRNENSNGVEIETQNTIYKLTYATVQAAA